MPYTEDGITTYEGADEPLVALWDGGVVTAGTIYDLCVRMRDVVNDATPAAVYFREGDELTQGTVTVLDRNDGTLVSVTHNRYEPDAREGVIALARYKF